MDDGFLCRDLYFTVQLFHFLIMKRLHPTGKSFGGAAPPGQHEDVVRIVSH